MKLATWNVNGIRARQGQLLDWLAAERPDVVCLQEIKATLDQLTFELRDVEGYWAHWHGGKGYSGVALLVARSLAPEPPTHTWPEAEVNFVYGGIFLPWQDPGVALKALVAE